MKENTVLNLDLLTSRSLDSPIEGVAFLRRLSLHSNLSPHKCGVYDPLRTIFDIEQIDRIVTEYWGSHGFNWKRPKPKGEGGVSQGDRFVHSSIHIGIWDKDAANSLSSYLRSEAIALNADIGCVQPSWPGQTGYSGPLAQSCSTGMSMSAFDQIWHGYQTVQLKDYVGQLAWATVFGPPYVRMFGRDRLLSAPAAVVEEISREMIYLQLTPEIDNVTNDLASYFDLRRRVKEHIGPEAFFDPAKGRGPYHVPTFELEPWRSRMPLGYIDGKPIIGLLAGKPIVQTEEGPKILDMRWEPSRFDLKG